MVTRYASVKGRRDCYRRPQQAFPSNMRVSLYSFWARMYDVAIVKR